MDIDPSSSRFRQPTNSQGFYNKRPGSDRQTGPKIQRINHVSIEPEEENKNLKGIMSIGKPFIVHSIHGNNQITQKCVVNLYGRNTLFYILNNLSTFDDSSIRFPETNTYKN